MENIVQHYGTWLKNHARELGNSRADTLRLHGFSLTHYKIVKVEHGSPIQYARELARKFVASGEFDCVSVHLVLLDCKNMDGWTGYEVYRKFTK
ncbi:hypothetical protein ABXZ88_003221 [Vibrio fluvialis]